jgi:hypothetical protein
MSTPSTMRIAAFCALAVPLSATFAGTADAYCSRGLGCSDSRHFSYDDLIVATCANLWTLRNSIFDENGYCFATAAGRRVFDNADCRYRDVADVPLNRYERANVETIREVERDKGCR